MQNSEGQARYRDESIRKWFPAHPVWLADKWKEREKWASRVHNEHDWRAPWRSICLKQHKRLGRIDWTEGGSLD
jgi:hypothetical protein